MSISFLLADAGLFVITDVRARLRSSDAPEAIRVSFLPAEEMLEAVAEASSIYPAPLVLILETGQAVVLSEGGKGGIAVQGIEGSLSPEQDEALAAVSAILCSLYGVPMEGEPVPDQPQIEEDAPASPEEEQ